MVSIITEMCSLLESDVDVKSYISKLKLASRLLSPDEYPKEITTGKGAYAPEVHVAIQHPKGLYHIEHQGAGHFAAYFTPKRKGSRPQTVGSASSIQGGMQRILNHEADLVEPNAPKIDGSDGPVNMFSLGRRK